jgi:hypothetical protein
MQTLPRLVRKDQQSAATKEPPAPEVSNNNLSNDRTTRITLTNTLPGRKYISKREAARILFGE